VREHGEHPVAPFRRRSFNPTVLALVIGAVSLGLLPFVPILPGVGSLLVLAWGVLACGGAGRPRWLAVSAVVVGALGTFLAAVQLAAVLFAAVGVSP